MALLMLFFLSDGFFADFLSNNSYKSRGSWDSPIFYVCKLYVICIPFLWFSTYGFRLLSTFLWRTSFAISIYVMRNWRYSTFRWSANLEVFSNSLGLYDLQPMIWLRIESFSIMSKQSGHFTCFIWINYKSICQL